MQWLLQATPIHASLNIKEGGKFFLFRVSPFSEESKNNFDSVVSIHLKLVDLINCLWVTNKVIVKVIILVDISNFSNFSKFQ